MITDPHRPYEPGGDPLDELLRQMLQRGTPPVQPPDRIWDRIQSQVTAGPAPTSHRPPVERLSRLLAPFVQGLAAAAIVILVGVSLGMNRGGDTRQLDTISPQMQIVPVATHQVTVSAQPVVLQRQSGPAAEDDSLAYSPSRNRAQRRPSQVERSARLHMITGEPDFDSIMGSRYAFVATQP